MHTSTTLVDDVAYPGTFCATFGIQADENSIVLDPFISVLVKLRDVHRLSCPPEEPAWVGLDVRNRRPLVGTSIFSDVACRQWLRCAAKGVASLLAFMVNGLAIIVG